MVGLGSRRCTVVPYEKRFGSTKLHYCVGVRVARVRDFRLVQNTDYYSEIGNIYLYYNESKHCASALDLMLRGETPKRKKGMIIELAISYADRNHDEAPFPFDCREGGQTLANHTDVYWKFGNFVERQPENLEEIAIESNLDFERDLDQYRGSISLVERRCKASTMLELLSKSTAHLDVFCVRLAFMSVNRVNDLASISCNWFVWMLQTRSCVQFTPSLVNHMACPVRLQVYLGKGDGLERDEERVRLASHALELTRHESVRALRLTLHLRDLIELPPDELYKQLRNIGQLDSLELDIHTMRESKVARQVVESLTPTPSFTLKVASFAYFCTPSDTAANRALFVPYVRKHRHLVQFDFCDWNETLRFGYDDTNEAQLMKLRDEHCELARNNAWLGLIRNNPSISLSFLVCRDWHRPAVLYFALQQRAAELDKHCRASFEYLF